MSLIYAEALVALICLAGLAIADPGVIQRTPETCFPLPDQVQPWVNSFSEQKADNDVSTLLVEPPQELYISHPEEDNQDTFCVKCLIWRKSKRGVRYFHCAVCQRCVKYYDHHCSVFGRCIAGTGTLRGNYKFFVTIIFMFMLAYFTTIVALVWGLSIKFGPAWAVPISVVVLWCINANLASRAYSVKSCSSVSTMFTKRTRQNG